MLIFSWKVGTTIEYSTSGILAIFMSPWSSSHSVVYCRFVYAVSTCTAYRCHSASLEIN